MLAIAPLLAYHSPRRAVNLGLERKARTTKLVIGLIFMALDTIVVNAYVIIGGISNRIGSNGNKSRICGSLCMK